ncbi:MAG: DoxX family protein [Hahellaceae bacterium]|nr:DoxX family protein [Hahellaceae bacterium]MCP5169630.1 DoxX family protein [Hahellaceae bacterium]
MSKAKIAGLLFVFAWFMGGGIGHFTHTEFFVNIMPDYLPLHYEAVYISGVFEILGAIGLIFLATRRWAGYGLILLTLCVTPANLYMWMHPERFADVPEWALSVRLVIQVMLLACIWWSTQVPKNQVQIPAIT